MSLGKIYREYNDQLLIFLFTSKLLGMIYRNHRVLHEIVWTMEPNNDDINEYDDKQLKKHNLII